MKISRILAVTVIAMAVFASTTFAGGSCGACPASGEKGKGKEKTEEGVQS